jgi:predicted NAD-dependent protein-ADP-ribosyltransferase YbiA (DUF1768 family)
LKSSCLRTVKNYCKTSKIHSSGDMRPGHRIRKVRKTDESVEICRKQANRDRNENPCKWRWCAVYRGFYYAVCIKVIMDIVYRMW